MDYREEVITDLAAYLGKSTSEIVNRIKNYTVKELEPEWEKYQHDIYTKSDIYLYDLTFWNIQPDFHSRLRPVIKMTDGRVLDFGGGIGTLSLFLARNGVEMFHYDLPGPLLEYAKWRAKRHNAKITFIENLDDYVEQFDLVIAIDVLEHLPTFDLFQKGVKQIANSLVDGGAFYHADNWGQQDLYPMHTDYSEVWEDVFKENGLQKVNDMWSAKNAFFPSVLHANQPSFGSGVLWGGTKSLASRDPMVAYQDKLLETEKGKEKLHKEFKKACKDNKWYVLLGIPIYGDIHVNLTMALTDMWLPKHNWVVEPSGLIEISRNKIITRALNSSEAWTHLWFIDTDVVPPSPHGLYRLLKRDKDVVLGLYAFKKTPARWMIRKDYSFGSRWLPICDPREPFKFYPKYKDTLLKVTGGGAGCMLIKREVFEKIPEPWFKVDIPEGGLAYTGEDIYFMEKCAKYGIESFVDTSTVCLHMDGKLAYPVSSSLDLKK